MGMHLRVGTRGGGGGEGLVGRSIGTLIDRPVDQKDELAAFRQPLRALVFYFAAPLVCRLHVVRSTLDFGSSARLDWLFSGWSPRAPPGHVLRLSLVLEVSRVATIRVESAEYAARPVRSRANAKPLNVYRVYLVAK